MKFVFLMPRIWSVLTGAVIAGCAGSLGEEFPSAYALLEGTVQRAQPSLDPLDLTLICGSESPGESVSAAVRTNSTGVYRMPAGVPTPIGVLPDSGALYQCLLRATFLGGRVATDTNLVVRFVPRRADVIPLTVNLRVGMSS